MAEATGVFFYVFPGIAAIASFTVNQAGQLPVPFYSNILQVGFAFAMGALLTLLPSLLLSTNVSKCRHRLRHHHLRARVGRPL